MNISVVSSFQVNTLRTPSFMVGDSEPTTLVEDTYIDNASSPNSESYIEDTFPVGSSEPRDPIEHKIVIQLPSGSSPCEVTDATKDMGITDVENKCLDYKNDKVSDSKEEACAASITDEVQPILAPESNEDQQKKPQIPEGDLAKLPFGYRIRQLKIDVPLENSEAICTVAAFGSNLYLGTSSGQLLHLYLFEDAEDYILISQLVVGAGLRSPITKILLLEDAELCLILCNKILYTYLLPEMTPCSVGRIKDVQDILMLSQVQNSKAKSKLDKIVAFTTTRIRLIQLSKDSVKLLKDIPYLGSVMGLSSAAGTLKNYSNICFVANATNYDVIDIQQTRRIPLSEFNPTNMEFSDSKHRISPFMVPFKALDKQGKPEEYLLVICSGSSSSMALFVNSEGDVTRGTLIWPQEGYPTGGIAVSWPHVIGLFYNQDDNTTRLCISSLETLEINYRADSFKLLPKTVSPGSIKLQTVDSGISVCDEELLKILQLRSCITKESLPSLKQYKRADVALLGESSIFFLEKLSPLAEELNALRMRIKSPVLAGINELFSELKTLSQRNEQIWPIYVASLLLAGQFNEVKQIIQKRETGSRKIDPRLLLLFLNEKLDSESEFFIGYAVPNFIIDLMEHKTEQNGSKEFYRWIIEDVYNQRDHFSTEINANFRKYMYTETNRDSKALMELIDSEKNLWIAQNKESDELLEFFYKNHFYLVLLHIFLLKQKEGNTFKNWEMLIIELGLELLSGSKQLLLSDAELQKSDKNFNLTEIVFFQLYEHINDENYFAKHLLELLKIEPETGLNLLKKNKGGKFLSCNKMILAELSKLVKSDQQFNSLKIEYSEQAFIGALDGNKNYLEQGKDLATELANYINDEHFHIEYQNLEILFQTYQVENDLKDSSWPKLTWIEFLHIHRRTSECKELALSYLKLYEVQVILAMNKLEAPIKFERSSPVTKYLSDMLQAHKKITYLLEIRDYSTADWVARHGSFPFPRTTLYSKNSLAQIALQVSVTHRQILENLKVIMEFYLALENESQKYRAINHVVNSVGGEFFTTTEILDFIPETFPLWCIETFISQDFLSMRQSQTDATMKKVFSRLDAKFSKVLLNEFERNYAELLKH